MKTLFEDIKVRTLADLRSYKKIILWGAGFAFDATVDLIGRDNIIAVFDSNKEKWGKTIYGFEIQNPSESLNKIYDDDTAIMISTNGYQYEIANMLVDDWRINRKSIYCNSNYITEEYRYLPELIMASQDKIEKVVNMLSDEASRKYYINFLKACLSRSPFFYEPNPNSLKGSYEYICENNVFRVNPGDIIIDCGAYDGDTARLYRSMTNNKCKVYCFEPVRANYEAMKQWVLNEKIEDVIPINAGVGKYDHIEQVYSTEEKTTKGAVGNNRFGADNPVISTIDVKALDSVISEKIDFIKMDIEGAEMDALNGAEKIIKESHPRMLLSAYHKTSDMWEIPLYISQIYSDYTIYLGHQEHAPYEPEFLYC